MHRTLRSTSGVLLGLLVLGACGGEGPSGPGPTGGGPWSWWSDPWGSQLADLGSGAVVFTHSPLALDAFESITPLGKIGLPQHPIPTTHIYFSSRHLSGTTPGPNAIRVPAAGLIVSITKFRSHELQTGHEYDDYHFKILHTNTLQTYLGHVYEPEPAILDAAGDLRMGDNPVRIPVSAGQVIGRATTPDFGVYDRQRTLSFVRPERYAPIAMHAVCPLDYFESALRDSLYAKVARSGEPRGGKVDYDVAGRLAGNWFLEGSPTLLSSMSWNDQVSFARAVDDAAATEIGFSGAVWPQTDQLYSNYRVVEGPAPDDVSPQDGLVVFRLEAFADTPTKLDRLTLVVEMQAPERLRLEALANWPADPGFTAGSQTFVR